MDATGLYAYRYLNTYVTYPCFRDGYPSGLGTTLVQSIPTEPKEFTDWLKDLRESQTCIIAKLKYTGPTDDLGCYRRPSSEPPMGDVNMRWVYTIDLDRMIFSVDNGAHFRLDNIPRGEDGEEWIRYLGQDGMGSRCLKASTPRSIVAELHPEVDVAEIAEDAARYHSLSAMLVDPEEWTRGCSLMESASLAVMVTTVKALIGQFYGTLCNACQYKPTDPRFQRPAECLLRVSAPNFPQLHLDAENTAGPVLGSSKNANRQNHSDHGVFYWFRGCLILLSTRLDSEMHLQASIVRLVAHVRERGIKSCAALIWSIRHIVVVRISHEQVMHSCAHPVLSAYGANDAEFSVSVSLMAHCLRAVFPEVGSLQDEASERNEQNAITEPKQVHAIDVTRVSLPTDIVLEIMKFVDISTYFDAFSKLCRATRSVFVKRPRIGSYTIYGIAPTTSIRQQTSPAPCESGLSETTDIAGPTFLAHTDTGCTVRLELVYQGHPYLGTSPLSALYSSCEMGKAARVRVRWPRGLDLQEVGEGGEDERERWRDVRQCGLSLQVLS